MASPFDITAAARSSGGPAIVPGTAQGPQGVTAPTGLFNVILAGLSGSAKPPVAEGTAQGATAFNTEQNWLDQGTANPELSLFAQSLEIAQGTGSPTLLPDTETMIETVLDPALAGQDSSAPNTGAPAEVNAPTQTSGQPALLTGALVTGIDAVSPALVSAPLPAPLPSGLRSAGATPTAPAPTPLVETASLPTAQVQTGTEPPKTPASGQPHPTPGSQEVQLASATKLSAGPALEFIATSATRAALPAVNGTPPPSLDTLVTGTLVADSTKPGAPNLTQTTNPGAQATQTTQTTQPLPPDLAASLQRQLSPESQRPQLGGNTGTQKPANGTVPGAPSLAPGTTALALAITPTALINGQAELMGTTSDPALAAQTLGQSAAPLSQASLTNGTPTSFTSTLQNAYQQAQVSIPNMAVEIARNFAAGNNRFQIRMDPPELGRIDVRLNIDESGALRARLAVERPETLDLLQRDARALERALAEIGFEGTKTNLEFSLKQNPFTDGSDKDNQAVPNPSETDLKDQEQARQADMVTATYRGNISPGGLDLLA